MIGCACSIRFRFVNMGLVWLLRKDLEINLVLQLTLWSGLDFNFPLFPSIFSAVKQICYEVGKRKWIKFYNLRRLSLWSLKGDAANQTHTQNTYTYIPSSYYHDINIWSYKTSVEPKQLHICQLMLFLFWILLYYGNKEKIGNIEIFMWARS